MINVTLSITNEGELVRRLQAVENAASDLRPAFRRIAEDFRQEEAKAFDSEGASLGLGWAKLSPAYAQWKAKRYPGRKILQRTGLLKASLTQQGAPGSVEIVTPNSLTLGTVDPTATYHQMGTRRMPQRKVMDVTPQIQRRWLEIVRQQIEGAIR